MAEPVAAEELGRAKRQAETGAWLGLQNSRDRAEALGHAVVMTGEPRDLDRQLSRSRAATPADLQRVARRLERRSRSLLWLTPAGAPGGRP